MTKRLANRLRRWLLDRLREEEPVSLVLDVFVSGQIKKFRATGIVGLCLVGELLDGSQRTGSWIVRTSDAADREHWWRVWEKLGGPPLKWEDGTPFEPPAG
jgi:hypothetical protein